VNSSHRAACAHGRIASGSESSRASCFSGSPVVSEIECRDDEGDVRECLRKVADKPGCVGIVFLCEQPDIVTEGEHALEESARFGPPAE
jgi:hypothetical protein